MLQTPQENCPPEISFQLEYVIDSDEDVKILVKQKKNIFIKQPEYIIATNKRLFFCVPNDGQGGINIHEYEWKYIIKCSIVKNITYTNLVIKLTNSIEISTKYLPKKEALKLYNDIKAILDDK